MTNFTYNLISNVIFKLFSFAQSCVPSPKLGVFLAQGATVLTPLSEETWNPKGEAQLWNRKKSLITASSRQNEVHGFQLPNLGLLRKLGFSYCQIFFSSWHMETYPTAWREKISKAFQKVERNRLPKYLWRRTTLSSFQSRSWSFF